MRDYTSVPVPMRDAVTYTLDGIVYTCRELSALEISEVMGMQGKKADSPESVAFMAKFFRMLLGDDQYDTFVTNCRLYSTPDDTVIEILQGIMQDMTDRPTPPLPDSSDGQRRTDGGSGGVLHSRVMDRLVAQGRPDLAAAVRLAQRGKD